MNEPRTVTVRTLRPEQITTDYRDALMASIQFGIGLILIAVGLWFVIHACR